MSTERTPANDTGMKDADLTWPNPVRDMINNQPGSDGHPSEGNGAPADRGGSQPGDG